MKVICTNVSDTLKEFNNIVTQDITQDILGYFIADKLTVLRPMWFMPAEYNKDYVDRMLIRTIELPVKGGAIVCNEGDLGFLHISNDLYSLWNTALQKDLVRYLKNYGINAISQGNDVLIDDKKFVGTASGFINNKHLCAAFISMNTDTAWLINKICLKDTKYKGFTGLNEYNICTRKIINCVLKFSKRWERKEL